MMAATDWTAYQDGLPVDMIKSIIPVSGLFELEPLRLSPFLNSDLRLDETSSHRASPANLRPSFRMPISVIACGAETEEYRRQSRDFAKNWSGFANPMVHFETPGEDHFTYRSDAGAEKPTDCRDLTACRLVGQSTLHLGCSRRMPSHGLDGELWPNPLPVGTLWSRI